ncbi:hypothetical protein FMEAI12_6680020 [Parafrankia sp. Ea1.12]|nr:hypothetical protein FMEAI12_6680020 [Parafrankia sp. Ea1.12]
MQTGHVFTTKIGTPIEPDNLRRFWMPLRRAVRRRSARARCSWEQEPGAGVPGDLRAPGGLHRGLRVLMHAAVVNRGEPLDPARASAAAALRVAWRSVAPVPGAFPSDHLTAELAHLTRELQEEINPVRRLRCVVRQAKRKMSRFLSWNPQRPRPPPPIRRPAETVQIIRAVGPLSDPQLNGIAPESPTQRRRSRSGIPHVRKGGNWR